MYAHSAYVKRLTDKPQQLHVTQGGMQEKQQHLRLCLCLCLCLCLATVCHLHQGMPWGCCRRPLALGDAWSPPEGSQHGCHYYGGQRSIAQPLECGLKNTGKDTARTHVQRGCNVMQATVCTVAAQPGTVQRAEYPPQKLRQDKDTKCMLLGNCSKEPSTEAAHDMTAQDQERQGRIGLHGL